jgi:hypothetical protein
MELEETAVARQWFCKHVSTATKSRDRGNGYTRNDGGIVGSDILYAAPVTAKFKYNSLKIGGGQALQATSRSHTKS